MENSQLESGDQEAINTIIFNLVVGHTAYAYYVNMDQLVRRGVDDQGGVLPRGRGMGFGTL